MAINLTKNGKTTVTTLELNCTEFIDWFSHHDDPDYEQFAPGFNFNCFMGCSERISAAANLEDKCNSSVNKYFIYGALCEQYERIADWTITEYKICGQYGRMSYSYKYEACVEYFDGTLVKFIFRADNRYSKFKEYEQLEKNKIAEEIKHLNDRTVLCLESEQELFKRACREITDAIQANYYDNIEDFECPNCTEVIEDWMEYGTEYSWMGDGCSPIVLQAVDHAFQWFLDGINAGLIYKQIKK